MIDDILEAQSDATFARRHSRHHFLSRLPLRGRRYHFIFLAAYATRMRARCFALLGLAFT